MRKLKTFLIEYDSDDNPVTTYESDQEAAERMGVSLHVIRRCIMRTKKGEAVKRRLYRMQREE